MSDRRDERGKRMRSEEDSVREGHELSDAKGRWLITFMILTLITLGIINLVIGGFGFFLYVRHRAANRPRSELTTLQRVPPEPRLQSSPRSDMDRMLAEENAMLNSYGWMDRRAGVVRIPIERSILLLSQRGLPPKRHDIPSTAGAAMTQMKRP